MNSFDQDRTHAPEHTPVFMNPSVDAFDVANLIRHQVDANRQIKRLVGRHRAEKEDAF